MIRAPKELMTIGLIITCYALWFLALVLYFHGHGLISFLLLTFVIAFHSSLQHEVLHGHPFKTQWLSDVMVFPALGIFIPFIRFRDTHLAHHVDSILTDPYDDPETNYLDPKIWNGLSPLRKSALRFNNTLFGRMVVGPYFSIKSFILNDISEIFKGNTKLIWAWFLHALGILLILPLIFAYDYPIWLYLICAYFGMSLLKIRTFLEHQAHEHALGRTVVIEDKGRLRFCFSTIIITAFITPIRKLPGMICLQNTAWAAKIIWRAIVAMSLQITRKFSAPIFLSAKMMCRIRFMKKMRSDAGFTVIFSFAIFVFAPIFVFAYV